MIKNTFQEKTFQDKEENFNDIDQKLVGVLKCDVDGKCHNNNSQDRPQNGPVHTALPRTQALTGTSLIFGCLKLQRYLGELGACHIGHST